MTKSEDRWYCVGRGFNGWHANGVNLTSSGGDLEEYLAEAVEDCLVYDVAHLDSKLAAPGRSAFFTHVLQGPMLDVQLKPDEVKKFSMESRATAARMLPGMEGAYRGMIEAALAPTHEEAMLGSFNYVGVKVFETLLKKIPGILIGHVKITESGPQVVWETEAKEAKEVKKE